MTEKRHLKERSAKTSQVIVIVNRSGPPDKFSLSSRLDEEIERAHRYQHFLSLIIVVVRSSVSEGKSLEEIIRFLKENTRKVDIISFYKKDKFALLLPETSKEGALSLGWRLKKEIAFYNLPGETKTKNKVCLGIACYPTEANSGEELLEKASLALKEDRSSLRKKENRGGRSPIFVKN